MSFVFTNLMIELNIFRKQVFRDNLHILENEKAIFKLKKPKSVVFNLGVVP